MHYCHADDLAEPILLHTSEQWRDEAAVNAHMIAPHEGPFMAAKVEALSVKGYCASNWKTLAWVMT